METGKTLCSEPVPTEPLDTKDISAVLDTNVVLDIFACFDLFNEYEKLGETRAHHDERAVYRRSRVRDAMLLAMHLHNISATTYSLHGELLRLMTAKVDADAHDDFRTHYTCRFLYFVKQDLLYNWDASFEPNNDDGIKGNAADLKLLAFAKEHRLPLITSDATLRKRAIKKGVNALLPREFWNEGFVADDAIKDFLKAFSAKAPRYIENHEQPKEVEESLRYMHGYYNHVLLGITDGAKEPVQVTLTT